MSKNPVTIPNVRQNFTVLGNNVAYDRAHGKRSYLSGVILWARDLQEYFV